MGKKKIIAAITAVSLSVGLVGFATACDGESGDEHRHTYSQSWSVSDTEHWHDATCEHVGKVDKDRAAHIDEDGNKRCDECDYNMAEAVAITIGSVTGGKVTADKTSYKEGDTVTLTIKADTGYTFKSILLGDADKTAEVADGKLTFTAATATTVTAVFEANPIKLGASVKDASGAVNADLGTVVFKNSGGYKYGDAVTLVVTPASDYFECTSLKISGSNKDYAVSIKANGEVNLGAVNVENLNVTAVFTETYKDIGITVKGNKLGVTELLAADTEITVRGIASDAPIKTDGDGKITVVKAHIGDTIYVSAAGYLETAVTVTGAAADYEATLEYSVFKELLGWGQFDFSKQNAAQPEISFTNDCAMIFTNDTYDAVTASMYIKSADTVGGKGNMGIMFRFVGDDLDPKGETVFIRAENNLKVQFACYADTNPDSGWVNTWGDPTKAADGTGWDDCIFFRDADGNKADPEAAKLLEEYDAGTLKLSAYRNGATVYVFLGDRLIGQRTFAAKYATAKCEAGFIVEGLKKADDSADSSGFKTWKVGITETAPDMTASVDVKTIGIDGNTVTSDKQEYAFGENIEFTVTPASGQKLDRLTVNGVDRTLDVTNGRLTVKADRTVITVEATFAERQEFELDLTVKGNKLGTPAALPQGTKIKLSGIADPFTVGADGKITGTIAKGKYTVSDVDGKYFESDVVTLNGELTEITLEYNLFGIVRWDADGHGMSHVNDADPYVEWLGKGSSFNVVTNEYMFDDVVVSAVIGSNKTSATGEKLQGVIIRFEDGKAAILSINMDGTPRLQFRPGLFDDRNDAQVGLRTVFVEENSEYYDVWVEYRNLTQEQIDAFDSESGIELKLARKGNMLYTFLGGVFMGREHLADGYADDKVGFGLFTFNAVAGQKYGFAVSETLPDITATVTDTTADAATAHGGISFDKTSYSLGETVTVTISPATDYKLKSLIVNGENVFANISGTTYKFVVYDKTVTVEAEFEEDFRGNIEAAISGKKFGVIGNTLKAGDKVTLTAAGMPTREVELAAGENGSLVLVETDISVGTWTVTAAGYKTVTIIVEKDQTNSAAIVLDPEETFELQLNWGSTSSVIAADGSAQLTITNEVEYSLTKATYGDIAVTLHLNDNNAGDNESRTQGIAFRFSDGKYAIARKEKNYIQFAHAQWAGDANGIVSGWDWQQLAHLDDADTEAYNNGDLPLTVVRKGNVIYVFLNSKYIGGRMFDEKYINDTAKLGMMFTQTPNGTPKTRKIEICGVDDAFEKYNFRQAFGEDKVNVFGDWTETDNKLSVTGKGLVEFNAPENTVKESVTMTISSKVAGEQGLIYTFADGRYVAIRWQANGENGKIQFTMDTVLYANGSIPGWTDWNLNEDEKAAFESDAGIELTLIRDGKAFYVVLDYVKTVQEEGGEVIGTVSVQRVLYGLDGNLDIDDKYAAMGGAMGIQIYDGKGGAFAYEHKTGDDVTVPTASEAGDEA